MLNHRIMQESRYCTPCKYREAIKLNSHCHQTQTLQWVDNKS